jgi:hypothetical protein
MEYRINYQLCLLLVTLLIFGCQSKEKKKPNHQDELAVKHSESKSVDTSYHMKPLSLYSYDSLFAAIDAGKQRGEEISVTGAFNYTVVLRLQEKNNVPVQFRYTLMGDDGREDGYGTYYFDSTGTVIGNKVGTYYQVFKSNSEVALYEKEGNKIKQNDIDSVGILSKIAIASREVSMYLQFFPKCKFQNLTPSPYAIPTIRTFASKVQIKRDHTIGSSVVAELPAKTKLIFLGATKNQDTVNGKTWIWYEVSTVKGIKGWVFGHPSLVSELNDENFQD